MKAHVIGIEISEGVSKKTGNAYAIGKLYTALPIVGKGARGLMGSEYQCEPAVLRKLDGLELPCMAELEMQDVMRYGQRRQEIVSVVPLPPMAAKASQASPGTAVVPR
ncbi:hypothetical protein SAMN05192589_101227 [Paracidovorax valerianellae]|uniref:Uncharacterized protein n=1 Tax=Paracidovorax valerianellae TaxID=187868 RepID=A0A1G6IQR0_9BURK|nr:hypothetical protein [Paracidovorax valerianellae]SDC08808.1 hypothetical protein SAMN05192589_101227 [Paracidovorax valerianellae]